MSTEAARRVAARFLLGSADVELAGVGEHVLPPLPYSYDALEPYVSEATLRFHHDEHHAGYVKGLNQAERKLADARAEDDLAYATWWTEREAFNWGGHILHTIYWHCMSPQGGGMPSTVLRMLIVRDFGSYERFLEQFKRVTKEVEGSGWGVLLLVSSPVGVRLEIAAVENHENHAMWNSQILLPVDVWEHAYYLDYQNRRAEYLDVFFKYLVDWRYVESRLRRAVKNGLGIKGASLKDNMTRQASQHLAKGRGKAKKDVGHGGLDEWFSGHGSGKSKSKGKATWGDWVSISPIKKKLKKPDGKTKQINPGDIVGPCGISRKKEWKEFTNNGKDPLKCMPRQKAYDMPKSERADIAKGKMRAEKKDKNEGKKPTHTRTFKKKKKKASATDTKTGDGEHVGLFIPLPRELADKFPSLGKEDPSPSHVTFLYVGDVKDRKQQEKLVEVLRESLRKWWPRVTATLDKLEYFDHPDEDRRVPHVSVKFDKDMSGFLKRVQQEVIEAGFDLDVRFPEFKPHVTLAYMPGMDAKYEGEVPEGEWEFDTMEVWGLPEVREIRLGPSARKVASRWSSDNLHRRVAARHLVNKIAGWWAITGPEGPGLSHMPPVPKGNLLNAIPGVDPAKAALYNGDGPADVMGDAIREIDLEYLMAWGRPATKAELQAVFNFCMGPIEPDGSFDYGNRKEPLNEWFIDLTRWLGVGVEDVSLHDAELLDAMRKLWNKTKGPEHLEPYRKQILKVISCDEPANELVESLEARLRVIQDMEFGGDTVFTSRVPKVKIEVEKVR